MPGLGPGARDSHGETPLVALDSIRYAAAEVLGDWLPD